MSKIRLELDTLQVDSFVPEPQGGVLRGTVHAHRTSPTECFFTETLAYQYTTCVQTLNTCNRTCFATNDCDTADCPTAGCATEDANVDTCGLSCVRLCQPQPVTLNLLACTTTD